MGEGRALLRRPMLWLGVLAMGTIVGVGIGVSVGWRAAMEGSLVSRRCMELERVDLEVSEIVDLKSRWKRYVRADGEEAELELSPREATFLLRGESQLGVWLDGRGEDLEARVTVPVEGGCYNVDYRGGVQVDDGLAVLRVDHLEIGGRDLTDLAGLGGALGRARQAVGPADVADPDLSAALENIERLRIVGGRIRVRFADPQKVWR